MTKRKYQKPLHIEMEFEEALKRFGTADPRELPENVRVRGGVDADDRQHENAEAMASKGQGMPKRKDKS